MGGLFSIFHKKSASKHKKHAILHTSQANGGARAPPPLATLLLVLTVCIMCNCKLNKTMPCDVANDITGQPHSPCVHLKTILLALNHFFKKAQYLNAQLKQGGPKTDEEAVHLHTFKVITAGILNCY